ncbi:serine/arginine repetitive matrix protein 1-like [Schistocerca cancellata]|uniref:serine/arginine repetitive matrix protein 1-like n=1 Tax=Schistocerca cancellata TaxID=274614 RepID=UPI0021183D5B|nr:serine/arginine repetitive matrix protein 1-like [Schistocerca cancellata]
MPPQVAANSVGESEPTPPPPPTTTTTLPPPHGAEVSAASAQHGVVGTRPPSLSGSDAGIPDYRDRVEPRPPVDVEPRTRNNTTEPAAVVDPVTTSENVALNVNDFRSLKPALSAEIPSRDSEIPTKKRPLEDTERNVDEDSSCETPVARRPKPSPEDLLEVEKGDGMKVDVAPTSAQGLTPPRTDSDPAGSDFSRKCDPEPEVTAEITASSAQPIQCEPYEEVPGKEPADSEAQRRAEGGNTQASPPRQQNNTTDTTPEPNIDDSQATAVAPFSHRRRLRQTPGLAVTRHQAKVTPEKKDIKKKNIKYEVIRANTDEEKGNGHTSNTTEPAAVVDPVTTSENVALNVNDFRSLKPALSAEIPSRDSEIPTKKRPLEDTERNVDEDSSCETPVARRPKPSPEDLLEVEKGDGMKVDVAPTSAQGLTPPRTDSDPAGSDFSRKCDPEPEVTAEITASSAQPIQCEPYEEVPGKEPADSEAQRRAEGGNTQASPPRQQNNTTDTTPEPNIDDSQATAVAPFSHRRRLRQTPGLAVTRHQAKVTPEKKDIKKKNIKYEVIRANTDEEKGNGHSDL